MKICDKCNKHKEKLNVFLVRKRSFDLCNDCLDSIVIFIENKKKNTFVDNFKDNFGV